jgi:hypothetical protein
MNELIERCIDADGCHAMEQEIKRRGLWKAYAAALTGRDDRPEGVSEEKAVLWGWSWEQRRIAARQVAQ